MRCAAAFITAVTLAVPAAAQVEEPPRLRVGRASGEGGPVVDGRVDDAVWASVPPYTDFIQQEPFDGQPATERTEIRFLLDERTLYVGVICFDSDPDGIVVSQSRRDADLNDSDSIRILLDTFHDGQNAFVFGTNPFGIEYDGQVMAEGQTGQGGAGSGGFNVNWDADWTVRTPPPRAAGRRSSRFRSRRCATPSATT